MNTLIKILHSLRGSRGQGVVEYGLVLIILLIVGSYALDTQDATERTIRNTIVGHTGVMNPKMIETPNLPTAAEAWNTIPEYAGTGGIQQKPVAFFTVPHTIYTGEKISYYDASYDPDGQIVERSWEGKVDVFNSPGTYLITLRVVDNDGLTDTHTVKVTVEPRGTYKKILHDQQNERRQILKESAVYSTTSARTKIIDHKYGEHTDLYGVKHVVIYQNYMETLEQRARDITYQVTIPLIEVTFDGNGNEISRKPYEVNGVVQYVVQTEIKTVPQPAKQSVVWKNNNWTYYVYNRISSVQDPQVGWGERSPSADFSRFDPETKITRQDPEFVSSRTSKKDSVYAAGWNAPSTPCKTCTKPNVFNRQSDYQSKGNNLSCGGGSTYRTTHDRYYNYILHNAYDTIYKYTGSGSPSGSMATQDLNRGSWRTEGWQAAEQAGGSASVRNKYTSCSGSGEECWNPLYNNNKFYQSFGTFHSSGSTGGSYTDTNTASESRYNSTTRRYEYRYRYQYRTQYEYYTQTKHQEFDCSWNGTNLTSSSGWYWVTDPRSTYWGQFGSWGSWTSWTGWY